MFDLGWTELMVIAVVAILVVGPKELPGMLRTIGRTFGQMRRMAGDFQRQFNDALKEAELDDVKSAVESVNKINPTNQIKNSLNPIKQAADDVQKDINDGLRKAESAQPKVTDGETAVETAPESTVNKPETKPAKEASA